MAELNLTKIWELKPIEGSVDTTSRPWLPVTHLDPVTSKRVTVRAPYPMGDADIDKTECPDCLGMCFVTETPCTTCDENGKVEVVCDKCHGNGLLNGEADAEYACPYCGGTGVRKVTCPACNGTKLLYLPDERGSIVCETCHGTGLVNVNGPITVTENGVISLLFDEVSLGVNETGQIFARMKAKDGGGIGIDNNRELYIKVDEHTIRINENGCLEVINFRSPYTGQFSNSVTVSGAQTGQYVFGQLQIDDSSVEQLHVTMSLTIRLTNYVNAVDMTRFTVSIGTVTSKHYCWDHTMPYTNISFDAIVRNTRNIPLRINIDSGDSVPSGTQMEYVANVISC